MPEDDHLILLAAENKHVFIHLTLYFKVIIIIMTLTLLILINQYVFMNFPNSDLCSKNFIFNCVYFDLHVLVDTEVAQKMQHSVFHYLY